MVLPSDTLTKREREILRWLHLGLKNADIGETVGMTEATIKNYVRKIFDKIGASNRVEAALWVEAKRVNLIEGEEL